MALCDVVPQTWTERNGRASIGGVELAAVADRFGTPAYVFDVAHLASRLEEFTEALSDIGVPVYATKAFLCTALAELIAPTDWWVDVVSVGEVAMAHRGGIPASRILLHGNLKSGAEIELAIEGEVAITVIDSLGEIDHLEAGARAAGRIVDVMIRLNEHVDLVTNRKVLTTGEHAKFGLTPDAATRRPAGSPHPGRSAYGEYISMPVAISPTLPLFGVILDRLAQFVIRHRFAFTTSPVLLDVGGGLASPYLRTDPLVSPTAVAEAIRRALDATGVADKVGPVEVMVEPGRALVANAAVLLYTVGVRKPLPVGGEMLALDGGLTDNPRPALYDSRYELLAADRLDRAADHHFRVFGRMCETDVLIDTVELPASIRPGDLVVMPTAGAYTFSMSSRYNALPRPPVLFVKDGEVREVVRRETIDEVLMGQRTLDEAESWSCSVTGSGT